MRKERYDLAVTSDVMTFEFVSIGPKGEIPKIVMYSEMYARGFYNLGFGDKKLTTGFIDDLTLEKMEF